MFFKRLSRSRSNSQSYVDSYHSPHDSKTNSAAYDDKYSPVDGGYSKERQGSSHGQYTGAQFSDGAPTKEAGMYSTAQDYATPPLSSSGNRPITNGYGSVGAGTSPTVAKHGAEPMPDLLTRAFNEAVRPYTTKLDEMENEIADSKAYVEQLESQRREVHAWIDKRGSRPDVPPSIAQQMDATNPHNPTHAAATSNAQLNRKITIVNFDLHRLQDDSNDSLPTPSFSACMLKFLPDIHRLSSLVSGPKHAFDSSSKSGGNSNSHGGLENGDEEDSRERRNFYARSDEAMVEIVKGRFREEGDGWGVQREIKRIEKTGAYLRNWGVEPYFPHTSDVMRDSTGQASGGATMAGSVSHGGGTPPAYQ